jgi:unsaturated rhamnogalacturonyl hydrolase
MTKRNLVWLVPLATGVLACASAPPAGPPPAPAPTPAPTPVVAATPASSEKPTPLPVEEGGASVIASVTVTNPSNLARPHETIAMARADIEKLAPSFDFKKAVILDGSGKPVLSQLIDSNGDDTVDEIVFQTDLGAGETRTFRLGLGQRHLAAVSDYRAYGRFVRERHDDFAWENDQVAHRMYGPDLETTAKEPLISSGIDVWAKRVHKLVVNEWYMTDDYHQDSGEGADFYSVGKSRGCGGLGLWSGGKLVTSRNFVSSRVLANGPIRLIFELTYAPWEVSKGVRVSETKRVVLDAGSLFNQIESSFSGGKSRVAGIGIAKHAGSTVQVDAGSASMRTWEPLRGPKGEESGSLGCAVVMPGGAVLEEHHSDLDYLVTTAVPANGKLSYFIGTAWDRGGRVGDGAAWAAAVQAMAAKAAAPVVVSLAAAK